MDILSRIQTKILELKPFIMEHGGDIEFVSFDNGLVKIKLTGACVGCPHVVLHIKAWCRAAT